jgi:murein L,D-transpeptidase YcbB/YkuD
LIVFSVTAVTLLAWAVLERQRLTKANRVKQEELTTLTRQIREATEAKKDAEERITDARRTIANVRKTVVLMKTGLKKVDPKTSELKNARTQLEIVSKQLVNACKTLENINTKLVSLRRGDRGSQVTELQRRLSELGYFNSPITGFFGSTTQDSVIRFQRDNDIPPDGIAGQMTQHILFDEIAASSTGELSVIELKKRLKKEGFYPGSLNNILSDQTQAAVEAAMCYYNASENDILSGQFGEQKRDRK